MITPTQMRWLEIIGTPNGFRPRNWAGCPYSVFDALVKKGLVTRTPSGLQSRQWDTYTLTALGRLAIDGPTRPGELTATEVLLQQKERTDDQK